MRYKYPDRIIPWNDYPAQREVLWDELRFHRFFYEAPIFPSLVELEKVLSRIHPIMHLDDLQSFEKATVEEAVSTMFNKAYEDEHLRAFASIPDPIIFDFHVELGNKIFACKYKSPDNRMTPVLMIGYTSPRELRWEHILTGLRGEIHPKRDVIGQFGEDFAFASRHLVTIVISRLFSEMVDQGLQYGYVCTGHAFIFLYIPDDSSTVHYHVFVPMLDVGGKEEVQLRRTAVSQVFTFVLLAVRASSRPPPQSWYDRANSLDTWIINLDQATRQWENLTTSEADIPDDYQETVDEESLRKFSRGVLAWTSNTSQWPHIHGRPFCTQRCLRALRRGGPLVNTCPNFREHQARMPINQTTFQDLLRDQLAQDRGPNADIMPLFQFGSMGALYKVRLASHGYTIVAKAVQEENTKRLEHEERVYNHLYPMQGMYVPVCLGLINLKMPLYGNGVVFTRIMCLSWGGKSVDGLPSDNSQIDKAAVSRGVLVALNAVHKLRVLHCDTSLRNFVYNPADGRAMVVDFKRSELVLEGDRGLPPMPAHRRAYRVATGTLQRDERDFKREMGIVVQKLFNPGGA
ncbi:hypothetical protein F4777DRAFT_566006 [Nemania sp. FL0916]|nr:hypothetical protein F4777DRAFT_566006 [Nemania sp. FL0916]